MKPVVVPIAALTLSALAAALPAGQGDPLVEVARAATLTDAQAEGLGLYESNCSGCHGAAGAGRIGVGPPLVHSVYRRSSVSDFSFQIAMKRGAEARQWRFGDMPAQPDLSESQMAAVIAYVRAVQKANGID